MHLKYDGVSFNIEAVLAMGREGFIKHRMHENHWPWLNKDEKEKLLDNVFELIQKIKGS